MQLVSVVIPAFNAARWIGDALRSVAVQTLSADEVIVVDNASTDGTANVAAALRQLVRKLTIIRNPRDLGPAASRNIGIGEARGEWIAMLDADDWFAPDRLARLIRLGARFGANIVADNQIFTTETGKPLRSLVPELEGTSKIGLGEYLRRDRVVEFGNFGLLKPIFRRSFLAETGIRYDEDAELRLGEDSLFYLACLARGERLIFTGAPLYFYRQHRGSMSRSVSVEALRFLKEKNRGLLQPLCREASAEMAGLIEQRWTDFDDLIAFRRLVCAARQGDWGEVWTVAASEPSRVPFFVGRLARAALRARVTRRFITPLAVLCHLLGSGDLQIAFA